MCEIQNFQRETETKALESEHTKYEVNPSILKWCMPKKMFRPQNLGIKSLTPGATVISDDLSMGPSDLGSRNPALPLTSVHREGDR